MNLFRLLPAALALILSLAIPGPARAEFDPDKPGDIAALVQSGDIAPLMKDCQTFIQFSDTHMVSPPEGFARSPELLRAVLPEVAGLYPGAAFTINTGDNTNGPNRVWQAAFQDVLKGSPLTSFSVPGNVDKGCYLGTWSILTTPDSQSWSASGWSSKQVGGSLLLFLDSTLPRTEDGAMRPDQFDWIDEALTASRAEHVFLFLHHPWGYMMNQDRLQKLLSHHSPRFRSITVVGGHTHRRGMAPRQQDGVNWLEGGSLQNGYYRVFHVGRDRIITYERLSTAYGKMAAAALPAGEAPKVLPSLTAPPAIMRTRTPDKESLSKPTGFPQEAGAWKANSEPPLGDVLRLSFGPGKGWQFADLSGCENDLFGYTMFRQAEAGKPDIFRTVQDGTPALRFGNGGAWELVGWNSRTLESPSETNRVTVEAGVFVPEQPVGWDYGLVGKGSYELGLDPEGKAHFRLWLSGSKARKHVDLSTSEPLAPGKWHRLVGTFDGENARFLLDGKQIAEEKAEKDARILSSSGPVVVGFNVSHPKNPDRHPFLISDVRVSNQSLP